ncbi:MAG: AMP-binding protein [Verrucomicrobiota bacterium]
MSRLREQQLDGLRSLIRQLVPDNRFYTARIEAAGLDPDTLTLESFFRDMPVTTRQEWVEDQLNHPPWGTNLTYPVEAYSRLCRTSGSTGEPMNWLDTPDSWNWMLNNWKRVLQAAGVSKQDTVFCAFSFGPFLGFWTAFEAASAMGCLAVPGGGLSSLGRLKLIADCGARVLLCTPTYAIHLAREAEHQSFDMSRVKIDTIIVAGEPGGSIPSTREQIATLWNGARVYDHHGMTEVGPVSYTCPDDPDLLRIMEPAYLPEVIDPETGEPADRGELVLTTLGRIGSPLLRYRTGDIVECERQAPCGSEELGLRGGILGRADDMMIVRGVNLFPSALEKVIRRHHEIEEYRVRVKKADAMQELSVEVEVHPATEDSGMVVKELEKDLKAAFSLRIPVEPAAFGSLPRFELKAKRWVRD